MRILEISPNLETYKIFVSVSYTSMKVHYQAVLEHSKKDYQGRQYLENSSLKVFSETLLLILPTQIETQRLGLDGLQNKRNK